MERGGKPISAIMCGFKQKLLVVSVAILLFNSWVQYAAAETEVPRFALYELQFTASVNVEHPFDNYLLKLELTDPQGKTFTIDGYYAGDGRDGQSGKIWKARICPYMAGVWKWRTVSGYYPDPLLHGLSGSFICVTGSHRGGLERDNRHFRLQNGEFIYLQGNFLDFVNNLPSTHVFMSHLVSDTQRAAILDRQRNYHNANKINVYFANRGDYGGLAVTPWLGEDKRTMDLAFWQDCDRYLMEMAKKGLFAELWFFADDSDFGNLTKAEKNRLYRYAMARTSAFSHTLYVIALEWQEGWSPEAVSASGQFIQKHNPWKRLLSVHNLPARVADSTRSHLSLLFRNFFKDIDYSKEPWADFIASQVGNGATAEQVNSLAVEMFATETIPHLSEEYGILRKDGDLRLARNTWANFCGGAAGGGTGDGLGTFMNFLSWSRIPFQRMEPMNELVVGGGEKVFCLAEIGHHYVVYTAGKQITLEVSGNSLKGYWLNPLITFVPPRNGFDVAKGKHHFKLPTGRGDWVLWITDSTNLNRMTCIPLYQ